MRRGARQGTAAVVLAGVLAAQPLTGVDLAQHTFMLVGDGAAGTAIAEVLAEAVARRSSRYAGRRASRPTRGLLHGARPAVTCP
jgi:malic enzyme